MHLHTLDHDSLRNIPFLAIRCVQYKCVGAAGETGYGRSPGQQLQN